MKCEIAGWSAHSRQHLSAAAYISGSIKRPTAAKGCGDLGEITNNRAMSAVFPSTLGGGGWSSVRDLSRSVCDPPALAVTPEWSRIDTLTKCEIFD